MRIPAPWATFFRELEQAMPSPVEMHCAGGFALLALTGAPRPTADVDIIGVVPEDATTMLLHHGGLASPLAARHGLHLERVIIAEYPAAYAERLLLVTPPDCKLLAVRIVEPHDLALSKLARNSPKDREDVGRLAEHGLLQAAVLRERYEKEMAPHLHPGLRADLTLSLWLEEFF
jgi:hypothetical protein